MARRPDTITGIELGTAAVKVVMGEAGSAGMLEILGYHESSSLGRIVKGEVVNSEAVADLLADGLNSVEKATGRNVEATYVTVTGAHLGSENVQASRPVTGPDRMITEDDLTQVTRDARSHMLPAKRARLHTFQRAYVIDGTHRVSNPVGMTGNKLTADVHLLHGDQNRVQTTCNLVQQVLGQPADDVACTVIADFYGLALDEEQRQGLLVVDFGAGVTEYAVFYADGCMHSGLLTIGCEHLANDLGIGLKLPITRARDLVRRQLGALPASPGPGDTLEVPVGPGHEPRRLPAAAIHTIVDLRVRELFDLIRADLEAADVYRLIGNGVRLCGGGALIPRVPELARTVLELPVSIGKPGGLSGVVEGLDSPRFVTPVGLVRFGLHVRAQDRVNAMPFWAQVKRDAKSVVDLVREGLRF